MHRAGPSPDLITNFFFCKPSAWTRMSPVGHIADLLGPRLGSHRQASQRLSKSYTQRASSVIHILQNSSQRPPNSLSRLRSSWCFPNGRLDVSMPQIRESMLQIPSPNPGSHQTSVGPEWLQLRNYLDKGVAGKLLRPAWSKGPKVVTFRLGAKWAVYTLFTLLETQVAALFSCH